MKIYVINLDRSPDRMAHMTRALGDLGLSFERFPAVDGRELSSSELMQYAATHRRRVPWLPGEIGNCLSHIHLWQKIAADQSEWSLVLEDDANLSRALPEFIERFSAASIQPDALVKIETIGSKIIISRRPSFFVGETGLFRLRTPHMGVAGYIIARFGAERLALRHTEIRDSIDAIWNPWVARSLGMRLFQAVPALVVQDDFDYRERNGLSSLIDSERVSRTRETRAARLFRGIRTFPRRGIVFGPRRAIPISR